MKTLRKLLIGLTSARGRRALVLGVAEAIEHRRMLRQGGWRTIVDVGANTGQFSLAALRADRSVKLIAFEPLEGPAATFRKLFAGCPRVVLHPCAIGATAGMTTMHVSRKADSSSLLAISSRQTDLYPGTEEAGVCAVQVRRLAEVVQASEIVAPALLKIDVQGFELEALRGCEEMLPAFAGVYVECSLIELYEKQALLTEVVTWLEARGFDLSDIGDVYRDRDGRAVQGDFLFAPRR